MIQLLATIACIAIVAGLFLLDRDEGVHPSRALWIPTVWLLINSSRAVSSWIQRAPAESLAQQYSEGSPLDAAIYGLLILAGVLVLNFRARQVRRVPAGKPPSAAVSCLLRSQHCLVGIFLYRA